jgi:hypothetical protein
MFSRKSRAQIKRPSRKCILSTLIRFTTATVLAADCEAETLPRPLQLTTEQLLSVEASCLKRQSSQAMLPARPPPKQREVRPDLPDFLLPPTTVCTIVGTAARQDCQIVLFEISPF